ncbi:hypothetical protein BDW02DRAFT_573077 [Decorospora gaudefroyi]|uniref:F-box domain-containing protein n=1 Tax=Decorospora gaudefroyi TaxID=184978 RepID=A0A6A5K0X7_9PLEO|nr:hypothetical protein BDW02DRAFT_573077 [Decorospora gaudefroyi]
MFRGVGPLHAPRTTSKARRIIRRSRGPTTTIDDLPNELLLYIGAQFTNLDRNWDLANLALVSKRWRPIAQEWLLKVPRFNITFIDRYMWQLGHRPELLSQVKSLEIWSTSDGRVQRDERGRSKSEYVPIPAPDRITQDKEFMDQCEAIIKYFTRERDGPFRYNSRRWRRALVQDVVPALFGTLLCALPHLRELKLGDAWLLDFPIFASTHSAGAQLRSVPPKGWKHDFLLDALRPLLPQLTLLEVPADMTTMYYPGSARGFFDFTRFENLTEIGVTMRAIQGFVPFGISRPWTLPNPTEMFPPTLELLKISEATHYSANFVKDVCLAKKTAGLPLLRRIEVYHVETLDNTIDDASLVHCLSPIDDVHVACEGAEIALYLYFPPCSMRTWESGGGSPWRLRNEPKALRSGEVACWRKDMGPLGVLEKMGKRVEVEWDADGDAVMV